MDISDFQTSESIPRCWQLGRHNVLLDSSRFCRRYVMFWIRHGEKATSSRKERHTGLFSQLFLPNMLENVSTCMSGRTNDFDASHV
jgi:hypothetical protein